MGWADRPRGCVLNLFITPAGEMVELSRRERQVLRLAAGGWENSEIAAELGISRNTVKSHLAGIFRTLGLESRLEAALWCCVHPHALEENEETGRGRAACLYPRAPAFLGVPGD